MHRNGFQSAIHYGKGGWSNMEHREAFIILTEILPQDTTPMP